MPKPARFTPLFIALVFVATPLMPTPAVSASPWQDKVDPWVLNTASGGETEFLVTLSEQADLSAAADLQTKLDKGTYVYQTLSEVARRTQKPVLDALERLDVGYRPYWVANMIWVRGDLAAIQALAARPDVAHLYANPSIHLDEPVVATSGDPEAPESIEWNIALVGADDVWAQGFTGQGTVIGGQDTGYDWDHPALINQYRGWDGVSADHNYNWHDATGGSPSVPVDPYGHGTHTMGSMVGNDLDPSDPNWPAGAPNAIGMAPGSQWIGCRNMDAAGNGTPATYIECYQWFIAPTDLNGWNPDPSKAPDVINNSWSCPPSEGCNPNSLLDAVQAVRDAGILTAHSAGNSGSACNTVNTPAAIYAESFTVGATNSSDTIAGFSSRGPVTVDGSGRRKPDISAPGSSVRSCIPGTGYSTMSGTSMAAPHVAGMVGLLISAKPSLRGQVEALEDLIESTAVHIVDMTCGGEPGGVPNNVYGWGRIDAWAAFQSLPALALTKTASAAQVTPGELLTYTLTITNTNPATATNVVLTDSLPGNTNFVYATPPYTLLGDTVRWDYTSLGAGDRRDVELVVGIPLTATGTLLNAAYSVRSDEVATIWGDPVETVIVPYALDIGKSAPERVAPGDILTYSLTVTNPHPFAATHNLVLTDVIPAETVFITATTPYSLEGSLLTWAIASLGPGEVWTTHLDVQVPMTFTGTIVNAAYGVRSDEVAAIKGIPVKTEIYALAVDKTASATALAPGDLLTYTLSVTNVHPLSSVHTLLLTDALPSGITFITATQPHTLTAGVISWGVPSLEAGTPWKVTLVVQVPLTTTEAAVSNSDYGVRSDETGTVRGNPVHTTIFPYDLSLRKTAPGSLATGGPLTYTLSVSNPHPFATAHNLVLTDALPAGTTFIGATGDYTLVDSSVHWELASLGPRETWTVHLMVQVGPPATISNLRYGVRSTEVPTPVMGAPVYTRVGFAIYFPITLKDR